MVAINEKIKVKYKLLVNNSGKNVSFISRGKNLLYQRIMPVTKKNNVPKKERINPIPLITLRLLPISIFSFFFKCWVTYLCMIALRV